MFLIGEGPKSSAWVYTIEKDDPICEEETIDGVVWTQTAAGEENVQECPEGMIGIGY